jgi:membrane protein DedA with SNARE-associated domain
MRAMSDLLGRLAELAAETVGTLGHVGVFLLMALEDVFPPIPSELVLPLAGFLVGQGRFDYLSILAASVAGSVLGGLIVYWVGRRLGEERLRRLVRRWGRFLLVDEADVDRAAGWFDRHGSAAVAIGRLVPGVRSVIALPAGIRHMPVLRFTLLSAAGATVWNGVLIGAGWMLGSQWERVSQYADLLVYGVLAASTVGVAWFVSRRVRRNRARSRQDAVDSR